MKNVILSLCMAFVAAFMVSGCKKSGGRVNVVGININTLDGRDYKKQSMMGKTIYAAALDPVDGFASNVNVLKEDLGDKFLTMDAFLTASKGQYKMIGASMEVVNSSDNVSTVRAKMGGLDIYQRIFRDSARKCFIVVTGTYKSDKDKSVIEACVDSAEL